MLLIKNATTHDCLLMDYFFTNSGLEGSYAKTFFYKENFLDKISFTKTKTVSLDNQRLGFVSVFNGSHKVFLHPMAFALGKLSLKELAELKIPNIGKSYSEQRELYLSAVRKYEKKRISFREGRKKKTLDKIERILILGPEARNYELIRFLSETCTVSRLSKPIKGLSDLGNNFDLIISSGYAYKIPQEVVGQLSNRIINLHASFLPWGRGIGTILFSFIYNKPTGVSIHLIDNGMDTGNIIHQVPVHPSLNDTSRTLYTKLLENLQIEFTKIYAKISSSVLVGVPQEKIGQREPYFSRLDFEKLMLTLPLGYDTKVFDLHVLGQIDRNNHEYVKLFNEL